MTAHPIWRVVPVLCVLCLTLPGCVVRTVRVPVPVPVQEPQYNAADQVPTDPFELAMEEVIRHCRFADLDLDFISPQESSLNSKKDAENRIKCRRAKLNAIAVKKEQKAQVEAMQRAEKGARTHLYPSLDEAMEKVWEHCGIPDITDRKSAKNYLPASSKLNKSKARSLCKEAKLNAIAVRDGTWKPPAGTSYGKEYRPPIRPDFSDGPLVLE